MRSDELNMKLSKSHEHLIDVLYVVTFTLHVTWCYYIFLFGIPIAINPISNWINEAYASIGFDWANKWSRLISSAAISSFALNILRRAAEGGYWDGLAMFPAKGVN